MLRFIVLPELKSTNVVYEPSMFKNVDHVNIMAYDGQWDDGYNASNLSPYPYTREYRKLLDEPI